MESELEKAEIERSTYVSEVREVNIIVQAVYFFFFFSFGYQLAGKLT